MKRPWRIHMIMFPVLTVMTMVGALFYSCSSTPSAEAEYLPVDSIAPDTIPAEDIYGVRFDQYDIASGEVRRNQTLSDLLLPYGVTMQEIYKISLLPDSLIDERKINQGNHYQFYTQPDSISEADNPAKNVFVYEKDPLHFVIIGIEPDSIWARNGKKPVVTRLQSATGTIETSLWESMMNAELNPMLAVELSEIYAWSIDFFGLQQGDKYKVIYEESYVDSVSIGINNILGAWFYHSDTDFWAIPFVQDSVRSFFDENGNSLRKAFLKAPLRFSRISGRFTNSRYHPILKIRRPHHGVDYAAPRGTPVHTVGDGVVTMVGYQQGGGGNYVSIKHNSVYSTTYMHLNGFARGIRKGVYVKQGDLIGYVGSTGLATGPHLDFRFYKNGYAIDPLKVEAPPVEPIHEENSQAYALTRALTIAMLKLL
jgi:murein DD-endopeptidase MepM/ murein hydrolase activator NlpD